MKRKLFTVGVLTVASALLLGCEKEEQITPQQDLSTKATVRITSTIIVPAGQTYDGRGNTIVAVGMGDGSQNEGQKAIFRLENGATLKNVKIGAPGCDGVHTYGNATLDRVEWLDVGEDAMTMKAAGNVTLTNCIAKYASDKVIQINANGNLTLNNFQADTFGKVCRTNGGSQFNNLITINGGTFRNGTHIVLSESTNLRVRYRNITTSNVKQLWKVPSSSQVTTY